VRFAALKALEELYRQLGEEFVVILLPESIPFLAELMEGIHISTLIYLPIVPLRVKYLYQKYYIYIFVLFGDFSNLWLAIEINIRAQFRRRSFATSNLIVEFYK